uniref:Uncharacterized protein n=1 Tax=Chromera velia CCMP2878 TaxID=1169474 RepID=A0A0G4H940_9ALVE|eukprot:Cvel_25146.t1-p1 / transcript=Cvel_25146.t1 / gene=Cvel_25146 / organism=Chromera_velia_CCMP2878 / gene_product=hypothetical protein / transcript_product=hypothetical protein / location=Cvel_scaffold2811:21499-23055(-) / protein_length=226 / sequence_SO=supercontig / SO=protein_coding / is_pseudo=false
MFTNFRSLFTLSTSDSSNVEKYIKTVKAAYQEISRLSLQEEIVPVWSGVRDKTDLSTWRVEKKLVPLLDPLTHRQGQLASLVLINGISNSTVRANVESSIAPHMPFNGDDGAVAKFRHFAQPSCFSRLLANPSIPAQTHGMQLTVDPASPVSPPLSLSLVVLTNGHLPACLKAAKQKKQHRGNRTQSHVVKTYSGESAVSPPVSSSCDSSPASNQPPSQQPKSSFS